MKTKLTIKDTSAWVIGALLIACATAFGQTNQVPNQLPPLNPFAGILANTVDTNNTLFATEQFQLRFGAEQLGVEATDGYGSSIGASWRFSKSFGLGVKFVNANVGGTLLDCLAGPELTKSYGNFQFTAFGYGGYNAHASVIEGEGGLRIGYLPTINNRLGIYTELGVKISKKPDDKTTPDSFINAGGSYSF